MAEKIPVPVREQSSVQWAFMNPVCSCGQQHHAAGDWTFGVPGTPDHGAPRCAFCGASVWSAAIRHRRLI